MKIHKNFKGFTLLELLIVIAIVGLIASVVFASISSARAGSRDTKKITEVKSMVNAINIFYNTNGYYPQTAAALAPTYIPELPDGIYYTGLNTIVTGQCGAYHIGASLEKNNTVLNNDRDLLSNAGGFVGTPYTNLCGNNPGLGIANYSIQGSDTLACKNNDTSIPGDKCYDLVP